MKHFKKISVVIFLLTGVILTNAQDNPIAGLKNKLSNTNSDTAKAYILDSLSMYYMFYSNNYDSSFYYANQSVNNAFLINDKKYLVLAYARIGFYYFNRSQYNAGLNISLKGLQLAEQYKITDFNATLYYNISFIYNNLNDSALSMQNAFKGLEFISDNKDLFFDIPLHLFQLINNNYSDGGNFDSALLFLHKMDSVVTSSKERAAKDISYYCWSEFYLDKMDYHGADSVTALGIASCKQNGDFLIKTFYTYQAISYFNQRRYKETITAAKSVLEVNGIYIAGEATALEYIQASYNKLGNIDSAYFYLKAADSVRNVVQNQSNIQETQQQVFSAELSKKEADANIVLEKEKSRSKLITYIFLTALIFFLLFGFIQWRNNLQKKKANVLLMSEKEKVETTLSELKSTQAQLIQSEKMASLGELTAGIAHEIQNPLNFVNNFSEVNKEMITELKEEIDKGNYDEAKIIANDIEVNEEKINHHGKRADSIVKGMLQHTRSSSGKKELTDINKLADEYLKFAYHGLRAKDKSFNAALMTNYDESVGNINFVSEDISRVLLNIYNNAFYAVNEKAKQQIANYEPAITVTTKKINDKVEISIRDNGNGIPQKVVDKIFQPFYTTKPTGQGTGLGLSLSYDIIKAHGGQIKVNTKEGDFTEFLITI